MTWTFLQNRKFFCIYIYFCWIKGMLKLYIGVWTWIFHYWQVTGYQFCFRCALRRATTVHLCALGGKKMTKDVVDTSRTSSVPTLCLLLHALQTSPISSYDNISKPRQCGRFSLFRYTQQTSRFNSSHGNNSRFEIVCSGFAGSERHIHDSSCGGGNDQRPHEPEALLEIPYV